MILPRFHPVKQGVAGEGVEAEVEEEGRVEGQVFLHLVQKITMYRNQGMFFLNLIFLKLEILLINHIYILIVCENMVWLLFIH